MVRLTRSVNWIKAARKDFMAFPDRVRERIATSLTLAAEGQKADISKPMTGIGSGVFEIALKYHSDAYRAVYALKIDDEIWVIHAFKKKSKSGIKTPREEIDTIKERIKRLKERLK